MDVIKLRILSIFMILIITGVTSKLIPENTNKSLINFISTLLILIIVFNVDVGKFSDDLNIDITESTLSESEILESAKNILYQKIEEEISKMIYKYDAEAKISIEVNNEIIIIEIISKVLSKNDITLIEDDIRNDTKLNVKIYLRSVS